MEMMLDKKQIQAIFFFKFKMGCKAPETTLNIHNIFGPGTANEHTVWWWLKKSSQGDESLEDEERSGQTSEADNDQLRAIIEADSLTTTREAAEELNVDYSTIIWHLKQIEKMQKLNKQVPHKLTEHLKKKSCFEASSSLILHNNEPSRSDCDMWRKIDFLQQPATNSSVAGPGSSKAPPKVKLVPKKRSRSMFGSLLPIWSTTAFWSPTKSIHLRSMLNKLMRCTENCNACCWH